MDANTREKLYKLHDYIDNKAWHFKRKMKQYEKIDKIYIADEKLQDEIQIFNNDIITRARLITEEVPKSVYDKRFVVYKKGEIDKINIYKNKSYSVQKIKRDKLIKSIEEKAESEKIIVNEDIEKIEKLFNEDDIVTIRKPLIRRIFKSFKNYEIVDNNKYFLNGIVINKKDHVSVFQTQNAGRKKRKDTKQPIEMSDKFFKLMYFEIMP